MLSALKKSIDLHHWCSALIKEVQFFSSFNCIIDMTYCCRFINSRIDMNLIIETSAVIEKMMFFQSFRRILGKKSGLNINRVRFVESGKVNYIKIIKIGIKKLCDFFT